MENHYDGEDLANWGGWQGNGREQEKKQMLEEWADAVLVSYGYYNKLQQI